MLVKNLKPDFIFTNSEGTLTQLVHEGWKQVNVLTSKKGAKRGGHYHKACCEAFFLVGGAVKLTLEKGEEKEVSYFEKGDMFLISPYQKHSFEFIEETIMVSLYDEPVEMDDGTKDIFSE